MPPVPSGAGTALSYPKQTTSGLGYALVIAENPVSINPPIIYEPNPDFTANQIKVVMVITGPPGWGGAQVWASTSSGGNYGQIGTVYQGGTQGTLTAAFPSGSSPDTTNTLSVDVTMSGGEIAAATTDDADLGVSMAYVGGELVGFSAVTLTSSYNYDLDTYITRGTGGSTIGTHAIGDQFGLIDGNVFSQVYPPAWAGRTVYFKFLSFNSVGGKVQGLADVSEYSYTLTGSGFEGYGTPTFALDPVTTGTTHTVVLSAGNLCTYWTSTTAGAKATALPGASPLNLGYLWTIKTTQMNFDTHTVTPSSGTIDGNATFSFMDNKASYSMISDGISNWMLV
jgi:hypothetical protein